MLRLSGLTEDGGALRNGVMGHFAIGLIPTNHSYTSLCGREERFVIKKTKHPKIIAGASNWKKNQFAGKSNDPILLALLI
jgi:hypothetical protein